jgi:bacterioferritin
MNMKGNEKLLVILNQRLGDELTAINQYMVHAEMCNNWGYSLLHKAIEKQAMDEMHHAEWLIERIIFLDGTPGVAKLNPIKIGKTVLEMVSNDQDAELIGLLAYNAAIKIAHEVDDEGSVDLLTKILRMEEGHVDWAEKQRAQIDQMGIENYLTMQAGGVVN